MPIAAHGPGLRWSVLNGAPGLSVLLFHPFTSGDTAMAEYTTFPTSTERSNGSTGAGPSTQGKDLLQRVTDGAHGAVDRMAEKAGPAVHKVESTVSQAHETLHHGADKARAMGSDMTRTVRETVREHPLTVVLLAVAVGAVIARMRH